MSANIRVLEKHLALVSGNAELEGIITSKLAQQWVQWGYGYLREGKMVESRKKFSQALALEFKSKTLLMKLGTYVPYRVLGLCHRAKTFLRKPPEITKDSKVLEQVLSELRDRKICS